MGSYHGTDAPVDNEALFIIEPLLFIIRRDVNKRTIAREPFKFASLQDLIGTSIQLLSYFSSQPSILAPSTS
jgi:hypothetical protein